MEKHVLEWVWEGLGFEATEMYVFVGHLNDRLHWSNDLGSRLPVYKKSTEYVQPLQQVAPYLAHHSFLARSLSLDGPAERRGAIVVLVIGKFVLLIELNRACVSKE